MKKKTVYKLSTRGIVVMLTLLASAKIALAGNMQSLNPFQNAQCPNPGGTQIANYQDGWHWVVGFAQMMWGKDTVYDMGNHNYIQCFYPTQQNNKISMKAVQTNWLWVGNISEQYKGQLTQDGWQLRHDGTAFGLPQNDYLVKNYFFPMQDNKTELFYKNINTSSVYIAKNNMSSSTLIISNQNTGGNTILKNTHGNVSLSTGDESASLHISNQTNKHEEINNQESIHTHQQIQTDVSGNGASSGNSLFFFHR